MVNLQKNPATFLPLFFTEWAKPTNFSYLVMVAIIFTLDFLPFSVLTLMWIEWGRMKIVNMSQSCCENFLTIFWFAVYETHRGFHCFKKVFLELFSLPFFIKWWNSTKPFFFCMSKQYFCQKNFSHRNIYNRNIIDLLKCTSMADFVTLFGFWQESH